jgi:hypothetical protein
MHQFHYINIFLSVFLIYTLSTNPKKIFYQTYQTNFFVQEEEYLRINFHFIGFIVFIFFLTFIFRGFYPLNSYQIQIMFLENLSINFSSFIIYF